MKVLIACEFSGIVRDAFRERGHDAWSCDLIPCEADPVYHIQGDVLEVLSNGWDLMIAHPPCTYLCCTGNKWFKPEFRERFPDREQQRSEAIDFFMAFAKASIERIAIENPVGIMSTIWRKADQIIHPYYFGDEFQKTTCLWLKNLPGLLHASEDQLFMEKTHVGRGEIMELSSGRRMPVWYVKANAHERSRTFPGIAKAMAIQWGET